MKAKGREPLDDPIAPTRSARSDDASGASLPAGVPAEFGDYRIEREIGRGGMGVVFAATQRSLGRRVAVKLLLQPFLLHSRALRRFEREARLLAHLDHPGIVRVIDAGSAGDVPFYAMELVQGAPLSAVVDAVRRHGLPGATGATVMAAVTGALHREHASTDAGSSLAPALGRLGYLAACAEIAAQVADALACAHAAGVVHRDVKPSNVLLRRDGSAVLTDFGLARQEGGPAVTVTGDFAGTPFYVSPEQARGDAIDHRTDVYSLGVTLYELLTLRRPFEAESTAEALDRILRDEAEDPRRFNPAIPADLAAIVGKAMAKDRAQRYAGAGDFAEDLRAYVSGEPVRARPPSRTQRLWRWARREPWRAGLVATAAAAVMLVSGLSVAFMRRVLDETERTRAAAALARENFAKAMEAVDQLSAVGAEELEDHPQLAALRRSLLQRAAAFYEDLRSQSPGDPRLQLQIARAHDRVGRVRHSLGDRGGAQLAHRDAIAAYDALLAAGQCEAEARVERAVTQVNLAAALDEDRHVEAMALLAEAVGVLRAEPASKPRQWALALALRASGDLLADRDARGAAVHYRGALAELEDWSRHAPEDARGIATRAATRQSLAVCLASTGAADEAEALLDAARREIDALLERAPDAAHTRRLAAGIKDRLAKLHHDRSRRSEAVALAEAAVLDWRRLADAAPRYPFYRESLGTALLNLGSMRYGFGDRAGAGDATAEAITVLEGLAASCPDVPRYRYRLARALLRALGGGEALAIANDAASRQRLLARARALAEELHAHAPDNVDYAKTLIEALTRGAASADADGDRAGAREALLRASAVCAAAAAGDASRIDLVDAHAVVLECLAEHQMDDGEDEAARATLDRALALVRPALEREARRPARRIAARALLTRSVTLRAAAGEHATALRELDELGELCDRARDRIEAAGLAATCARAADGEVRTGYVDRAFAILRREGAADALAALSSDPRFAVLRDDPRFAELQRAAAR